VPRPPLECRIIVGKCDVRHWSLTIVSRDQHPSRHRLPPFFLRGGGRDSRAYPPPSPRRFNVRVTQSPVCLVYNPNDSTHPPRSRFYALSDACTLVSVFSLLSNQVWMHHGDLPSVVATSREPRSVVPGVPPHHDPCCSP
jgi:hypothetical protein